MNKHVASVIAIKSWLLITVIAVIIANKNKFF